VLRASLDTLTQVTSGTVVHGAGTVTVNGVAVDSREVTPGCLYVAFRGEHADGHDFVAAALTAGARAALVTRWDEALETAVVEARRPDVAIVQVADALTAVSALAAWHRARLNRPVIGITGSTGKTTTKDFIASALATKLNVVATRGNRNNELGVPLTLLEAGSDTDVVVVEMGMRGPGQIAALCRIASPTAALVTNVGMTHIEVLGSQEAIVDAKAEIVRCIGSEGRVFLNGDDALSARLAEQTMAPVVTYGTDSHDDVRAVGLTVGEDGLPSFTLEAGDETATVTLPLPGRHNAYNAAAAAAVALYLGLSLSEIAEGLGNARTTGMRMEVFSSAGGVTVINDAYNASPTSMRAALATLREMPAQGRRIAVLGDMAELGSLSELAHFGLGELVPRSADILVTVGTCAQRIAEGARAEGMPAESVRPCANVEEAREVLDDLLAPGDVVLVKASRVMQLERIVEGIVDPHA
jgi:UDP-N-acetylmuramoyl-tripeptide--D-alanyl-D-alanine ligase